MGFVNLCSVCMSVEALCCSLMWVHIVSGVAVKMGHCSWFVVFLGQMYCHRCFEEFSCL